MYYKQNSWPKDPSGAVQRVMFYRSQAGIRAWPQKSNTPLWGDVGSPSAETQCCETKHKSINMVKVLKTKVKGSVNICQYNLRGTQKSVRDFGKTGEVTWKATAELGGSKKKMDLGIGYLQNGLVFQDFDVEKSRVCKWSGSPRCQLQCYSFIF